MHLTGLDFLLWAAGFIADLALLFVFWFRRRASAFPIFTTYITANVVRTIVLYALLHFEQGDLFLRILVSGRNRRTVAARIIMKSPPTSFVLWAAGDGRASQLRVGAEPLCDSRGSDLACQSAGAVGDPTCGAQGDSFPQP